MTVDRENNTLTLTIDLGELAARPSLEDVEALMAGPLSTCETIRRLASLASIEGPTPNSIGEALLRVESISHEALANGAKTLTESDLRTVENRIRTLADHWAAEIRARAYPYFNRRA